MYLVGEAATGQKFGPTDLDGLVTWVAEGRVLPHTLIEDATTMVTGPASQIRGLFPEQEPQKVIAPPVVEKHGTYQQGNWTGVPPGANNPYQEPPSQYAAYPRPGQMLHDDGSKDYQWAMIYAATGFCACFVTPIGIYYASQAKKKGHPKANLAMGLAIAGTAIMVLRWILGWAGQAWW